MLAEEVWGALDVVVLPKGVQWGWAQGSNHVSLDLA